MKPGRKLALPYIFFLLVALLWVLATFRIQTYVSGQDPVTYMRLARTILAEPLGSPGFRAALTEFAPGYPLILAAAIRVGGRFAPHWVNLGFAIGLLWVYARIVRRMIPDCPAPQIFLLVTSLLLLGGHWLNPHFLLYPFRAMPAYFFAFLGMLLVLPREDALRPGRLLAAGFSFLASIAIREPMVFAAAGAGMWLLVQPGGRARVRNLAAFCAPFLLAAACLAVLLLRSGSFGTDQFGSWLRVVQRIVEAGLFRHLVKMLGSLGGILQEQIGWLGLVLLGVGFWELRKQRAAMWLFGLPALLLTLFYSLYPYPHRRYFITILLYLCPMVALGLNRLLDVIACRAPWPKARLVAYGAVSMLLLGMLGTRVMQMEPWGTRVSRQEVLTFYDSLYGVAVPDDLLFMESACRNLWDVLQSYSRFRIDASPDLADPLLREGQRGFYFEPLNEEAYYDLLREHWTPSKRTHLLHRFDLVPLPGQRLSIAGGEFQLHEIRPWTETSLQRVVPNVMGENVTVWIDLRAGGAAESVRLGLEAGAGEFWWTATGGGVHALTLPAASNTTHRLVFMAEAETPLPGNPVLAVLRDGRPIDFSLTSGRSLSSHAWFQPPFRVRPRGAIALEGEGLFVPPPVHGHAAELHAMFLLSPSPPTERAATLILKSYSEPMGEQRLDLSSELARFGTSIPLRSPLVPPAVSMQLETSEALESHLRVRMVRYVIGE